MTSRKDLPIFNPIPVILLVLICLILLFSACRSGVVDEEDFSAQLGTTLKPVDTTSRAFKKRLGMNEALRLTYQQNGYHPFWIREKGISGAVEKLQEELEELRWDGLVPEQYHMAAIREQAVVLKKTRHPQLAAVIAFDTLCTKAYLQASRDLLLGRLAPRSADSLWYSSNDSAWQAAAVLASRLGQQHDYPELADYRSRIRTYALLQQALREYQPSQETDTGTAGTPLPARPDSLAQVIRVNLERLRWLPQEWPEPYILVNIPQMELMLRDHDRDIMRMRVVVGRPSRQTPALSKPVANIVFNPSWGVPPTILKKDVLPGLAKSGEAYLQKKNLRAYDRNGNPVDAGSIDETNYKDFVYRQPPGDENALGVIKFNMPNVWNIYLHDTPEKGIFSQQQRDKSSGCVRVEFARKLAEYILSDLNGKQQFTPATIDSIVSTHKTHYEPLKKKLPVHLVYLTAFEDSSVENIRFIPDIYQRDRQVARLLEQQLNRILTGTVKR